MADACSPPDRCGVAQDDAGINRRWNSAGTVVLEVVDEVDLVTAPSLLAAVEDEFDRGCRSLVLDLAGVSFCSARGLGTFVEVRQLAHGRGATVHFAHPSAAVCRTVALTRSHGVLDGETPQLATTCTPTRARSLARWGTATGGRLLGLRAPTPSRG